MNAQPRTRAPRAVWFPDWFQGLQQTDLPESTRSQYRTVVLEFLRFCKQTRQAATIPSARQFIRDRQAQRVLSEPDRLQWQEALNWFFREALHRPLGDFGNFTRARKVMRVPVVLTREECQRLFSALEGVPRLMAELMYGSGLRLTELLCLRVKDLDLDRRQLMNDPHTGLFNQGRSCWLRFASQQYTLYC